MQVLNFGKMEKINFLVLALLLFAFGNSKAQVINNKADSNRVCLFDVLGNKQYDANSEKISIVTALEETTQLIEGTEAYKRTALVVYTISDSNGKRDVKRKVLDEEKWQNDSFMQEHKKNVANLIGTPLTLTFVSRNSNKKGCYPCKKSIVDDSTIYTINEFNEKMGDYHVLSFKLNFTGITEELHFASRASKLYLNDLKQVNTTWMINAHVGKKSYGCNVLKEKLSILNVYYVTPKEAKSIYKSKNLTLTKILRK